jgi:AraC family transcriptional regulator, transcriptional activator of pobA
MESLTIEKENIAVTVNSFSKSSAYNGRLKPVFSNFYALIWFKRTTGRYFLDFKEYQIKENSLIIISKSQDISFEFTEDENQYVVITLPQSFIETSDEDTQKLLSFCIREHFEGKQILEIGEDDEKYLNLLVAQLIKVSKEWDGELKDKSSFYLLQLLLVYCTELSKRQRSGELDGIQMLSVTLPHY